MLWLSCEAAHYLIAFDLDHNNIVCTLISSPKTSAPYCRLPLPPGAGSDKAVDPVTSSEQVIVGAWQSAGGLHTLTALNQGAPLHRSKTLPSGCM